MTHALLASAQRCISEGDLRVTRLVFGRALCLHEGDDHAVCDLGEGGVEERVGDVEDRGCLEAQHRDDVVGVTPDEVEDRFLVAGCLRRRDVAPVAPLVAPLLRL